MRLEILFNGVPVTPVSPAVTGTGGRSRILVLEDWGVSGGPNRVRVWPRGFPDGADEVEFFDVIGEMVLVAQPATVALENDGTELRGRPRLTLYAAESANSGNLSVHVLRENTEPFPEGTLRIEGAVDRGPLDLTLIGPADAADDLDGTAVQFRASAELPGDT